MGAYSRNKIYEEITKSLVKALKRAGDKVNVTFSGVNTKFYLPYFAEDAYKITRKKRIVCKANTATLWKILESSVWSVDKWSKKKRRDFARGIIGLVRLKTDDPFCKKGYIRMSEHGAEKILNRVVKEKPVSTKLQVLLWSIAEKNYGAQHNLVQEVHGPYDFNGNKFIFYDFSIPGLPFNRVISMFSRSAIFDFDVFNNYFFSETPLKQWVVSGGKVLNAAEIRKMNALLTKKLNDKSKLPKDLGERLIFVLKILWLDLKQVDSKSKIPDKIVREIRRKKNWVRGIRDLFV